jgi:hypothetical protein
MLVFAHANAILKVMENSVPTNSTPAPEPSIGHATSPAELAKQIYPEVTAKGTYGPSPSSLAYVDPKEKTHFPFGVALLAGLIILDSIVNLFQSKGSAVLLVISGLSLLLGLGLLLRHEIARMIFIWITVIFGILLKIPILIFFASSFNPYHDSKIIIIALIGIALNLAAVFYLNLPHVKNQFS